MAEYRHDIAALLSSFNLAEGVSTSPLEELRFLKVSGPSVRQPIIYDPQIVIVGQGRKIGYLHNKVFTYDVDNFLLLSVQLPFECETSTDAGRPYLAVSVDIDIQVLAEIMHDLDDLSELPPACSCVDAIPMTDQLREVTVRLLRSLKSADDSKILGPALLKELTYRVLQSSGRNSLIALAVRHSYLSRIAKVIQYIHRAFEPGLSVAGLAERAHMSVSAFHHNFKEITGSSPLQYVKSIRLHKARLLIARDGLSAGDAAERVGYVSSSQFSREYKRFFGESPIRERLKRV